MKKLLKIIGVLLVVVVLVAIGGITYITQALPNIAEPTDLHVEITPERVARGAYLANHVTVCMDCHSTRDWNRFSGPTEAGTLGKGGELFDKNQGFPGSFTSKNITPFNLKGWSDGDIYRTITSGVDKDGNVTVRSDAVREVLDYAARLTRFLPEGVYGWDGSSNNRALISGKSALIFDAPSAWSA